MDIEKLIEQLNGYFEGKTLTHGAALDSATALSTLQTENKRLNKIVCSIPTTPDSGRTVSQYEKEMSMCEYLDYLEAENERLRAELEQASRERDAAVKDLNEFLSLDELCPIQCKWCKWENTNCDDKIPEWRGPEKED